MAVIFMLSTNGYLSQHGYVDVKKKTKLSRHRALMRVFRSGESPLRIFRKLHALVILFKNKDPKLSKIFKEDRDWVKKKLM
jgi:hypothetical protein|tara:strand:+ start:2488 stop:2730 length:243 start_codon:yes stop_codon:yes gene_type:complete